MNDDDKPDPRRERSSGEQQEMVEPHRVEQQDAEQPPLHRDGKCLVVRVADDLGLQPGLPDRIARKLRLDRAGAVAEQRGLGKELDRLAPVGQSLRRRRDPADVLRLIFDADVADALAQIGGVRPDQRGGDDRARQQCEHRTPAEMTRGEQYQQHRHVDQRGARQRHEQHVGDEGQRQCKIADGQLPFSPAPRDQRRQGQREGAEREFLALVDIVLDGDAGGEGVRRLQAGDEQHDPGQDHQQRARGEEGDQNPGAALASLEVVEKEWDQQQLRHRLDPVQTHRPGAVRP